MAYDVSRLESMSPTGSLRLHIQDDGDVVVVVTAGNCDGDPDQADKAFKSASVEFCTYSGGGGSTETWKALQALAIAMAKDNADPYQAGRRGEFLGSELLPVATPPESEAD